MKKGDDGIVKDINGVRDDDRPVVMIIQPTTTSSSSSSSLNKEIGVGVVTLEKLQRKRKIVDNGKVSKRGNRLVKGGD